MLRAMQLFVGPSQASNQARSHVKIAIISDLHGNYEALRIVIPLLPCDALW